MGLAWLCGVRVNVCEVGVRLKRRSHLRRESKVEFWRVEGKRRQDRRIDARTWVEKVYYMYIYN